MSELWWQVHVLDEIKVCSSPHSKLDLEDWSDDPTKDNSKDHEPEINIVVLIECLFIEGGQEGEGADELLLLLLLLGRCGDLPALEPLFNSEAPHFFHEEEDAAAPDLDVARDLLEVELLKVLL